MTHKSKSITCNNNYFNTIVQNGKDKGTRKQVHFEEQLNDSVASSDAECPICGAIMEVKMTKVFGFAVMVAIHGLILSVRL